MTATGIHTTAPERHALAHNGDSTSRPAWTGLAYPDHG